MRIVVKIINMRRASLLAAAKFVRSRRNGILAIVLLAVGLGTTSARATVVTYSSYTNWSSAVSGAPTIVTIPDPGVPGFDYFVTGSVTYSGVTFTQSSTLGDGFFFNVGPGFSGLTAVLSSQGQSTGVANILITLPTAETAFALNFGTFDPSHVTFLLFNGDDPIAASTGSGYIVPDFFGITDTNPFTSVLVTTPDIALNVNNIQFGSVVAATPLPSTWFMLLSGLVGLGFFAYRRTKNKTVALATA